MPPRKRSAPEPASDTRRRSRRISSTTQTSRYFEDESDDELVTSKLTPKRGRGRPPKTNGVKVQKEEEDELEEPYVDENDQSEEPYVDEEDEENDKEEQADSEEEDSDAPRKVTVIPLEKMRDTGGVEYDDAKLHKNTLLFLKDLKANNRRPWLKSHDGEYRRSVKDWQTFVERATESVIDIDETIPELPAKDVIFRIHRDIRFSKDPTPYKPHFSAAWSRTGRKGPYACYYVHVEPRACFVGGGLWCPSGPQLQALRASIDERPRRWRRVLSDPAFAATFLPSAGRNPTPEAAITAFTKKNKENALKTKPKGFLVEHRDIELLKLRNFTVGTKVDETIFIKDDALDKLAEIIRPMVGFVTFLNDIVMPDPNADDEESDEENEDSQEEDARDEEEDQ